MKVSITKTDKGTWHLSMASRFGSLASSVEEDHPSFESAERARRFYVENTRAFQGGSYPPP